ncbi:MAG TPA: hypothetical protein VNO20_07845 [Solirubrobacterales bacterium]|nr:hypothetical protein [Solirubrobacterales bacterium]
MTWSGTFSSCAAVIASPSRASTSVSAAGRSTSFGPAERLAVETDSHRWHRGSVAFEDDHARDLDLRRRGYAVRRFT